MATPFCVPVFSVFLGVVGVELIVISSVDTVPNVIFASSLLTLSFPALSIAFACTLYVPVVNPVNALDVCQLCHALFLYILYSYLNIPATVLDAPLLAVSVVLAPTVILFVVCVSVTLNAFGATLSTFCMLYVTVLNEFVPSLYFANIAMFSVTVKFVVLSLTVVQLSSVSFLYCFI